MGGDLGVHGRAGGSWSPSAPPLDRPRAPRSQVGPRSFEPGRGSRSLPRGTPGPRPRFRGVRHPQLTSRRLVSLITCRWTVPRRSRPPPGFGDLGARRARAGAADGELEARGARGVGCAALGVRGPGDLSGGGRVGAGGMERWRVRGLGEGRGAPRPCTHPGARRRPRGPRRSGTFPPSSARPACPRRASGPAGGPHAPVRAPRNGEGGWAGKAGAEARRFVLGPPPPSRAPPTPAPHPSPRAPR